jgi:flagellar biosynthesis/type III secretory pathway protein FliH
VDVSPAREPDYDGERVEAALAGVRDAVGEYRKDQAGRLRDWQRAAVELALTIATRLLHERVASGEFPMEAKVRDMVAQLGEDAAVTVRLNPADLAVLASRLAGGPLTEGADDPKFVPDDALGRGECRVEGREAMLLSDVSRELQEIRDELLRSIAHARP